MMQMRYCQRVRFWMRNGWGLFEAMWHGRHEFPRKMWVQLKQLRIENIRRKKDEK